MFDVIKVEHEDELETAEAPAFYVMGVAHGYRNGRRITTASLLANDQLRDFLFDPVVRTARQKREMENDILYLLFGTATMYTFQSIVTSPGFSYILFAFRET